MIKRAVRGWCLAALTAMVLLPLHAQSQSDYRRYGLSVQEGGQRTDRADRDDRRRSRDSSQRQQDSRGRSMTPDERRDLNRDLQRANREFYRKGRDGR